MNKTIYTFIACSGLATAALLTSCSSKNYPQQTTAPAEVSYVPFTKMMKQRMDHEHMDVKKVQFYVDQTLMLNSVKSGSISGGDVSFASNGTQAVNEISIPAYTPGVCEKVSGDSLYISFESAGKTIIFSAVFANQYFVPSSETYYGGVANVIYDNKPYALYCPNCGSAANAKLVVRRTEQQPANVATATPTPVTATRTITGRTVK